MHRKNNHIIIRVHALQGEEYFLRILTTAILICIMAYAYFVIVSILNVIAHKDALAESDRLQSEVARLEEQYFALNNEISPAAGAELGMTATRDTAFVRRPGAVGTTQGARSF